MPYITKHQPEQEWESHRSEDCWVDLFVAWDSIRVNDLLVNFSELICLEKGWWHKLREFNLFDLDTQVSWRLMI